MEIVAHRGASGYCPENTMAAFEKAVELNVDSIELDIRLTKDGIPVICHDAKIKRTSNGEGYIHELTLEELKQYDFGSWYGADFEGERIPTLEEVLIFLKEHDVKLNIEIKNGPILQDNIEEEMLRLVSKYDFNDRVWVSSFDHQSLKKVTDLDENIRVGFIFHLNLVKMFDYIDNSGIEPYSIHPNYFYITKEMIAEAHKRNYKVFAYTVDDIAVGEKYEEMGVDGMVTNKPLAYKQSGLFGSNKS